MILKQVSIGITSTYGATPENLIDTIMYIPESSNTKAELQNAWDLLPYNTTVEQIITQLSPTGIFGGGFPSFYPGFYTGITPIESMDDYATCLSGLPYTTFHNGSFGFWDYVYYLSKDGEGYLNANANQLKWKQSGTDGGNAGGSQLGIWSSYGDNRCKMSAFFITSDNYVGVYNIGYNRNNSGMKFFSLANSADIIDWINNLPDIILDPYAQGGDTTTSEATGDFDDSSDPIDFPTLPAIGATDTGLVTLYNPSLAEIQALANYMWTNPAFDLSAWKKIFADPIDAILGLSIVPVDVPDGGVRPIAVGNLATDVNMNVAAQQYIEVQCGSLNVNEFWSSYLDYDPFTKAEIYLPYCGTHQLSVDDIMNKTIEVRYHIDILSGSCCAYVKCGDSVLYQFIGQCSSSIPVASGDFSEIVSSAINAALAVGSVIATGGATAPFALTSFTANAVNILKEKIQKSGAISGTGGMLAIQKPYLILTRPRQAHPANQNHYTGYPSFITENLSELSGYTEIEEIHLENVQATDTELNEIVSLLESGVIF